MKAAGIFAVVAALGAMTVATPATVAAQEAVPQEAVPQEQEPVEVTEELLDRFVAVYPSIMEVAQSVQAELAQAETAEEAQAIQAEAQTTINVILEDGEMTVREYEAVVTRLREDPEMMAEVETRLRAEAEEDGEQR